MDTGFAWVLATLLGFICGNLKKGIFRVCGYPHWNLLYKLLSNLARVVARVARDFVYAHRRLHKVAAAAGLSLNFRKNNAALHGA